MPEPWHLRKTPPSERKTMRYSVWMTSYSICGNVCDTGMTGLVGTLLAGHTTRALGTARSPLMGCEEAMLIKKDSMNGCRPHRRRRPFLLGGSGYVTCTAPYRAEKHEEGSVMPLYRVSFDEQGSSRVESKISTNKEANPL